MRVTLLSVNCNDGHYGLGILSLAAMLRQHRAGDAVAVVNVGPRHTVDSVVRTVVSTHPDVLGVSLHHANWRRMAYIVANVRALVPGVIVIGGGTDVLAGGRGSGHRMVDHLVAGEGEHTLVELLATLEGGEDVTAVPGVSTWQDGALRSGPPRPFSSDLDSFPSPYLTGTFTDYDHCPAVFLETYRGCTRACAFCYEGRGRRGVAMYSPERVEEELRYLVGDRRVPRLEFYDTIFNLNRERTLWLLKLLIDINIRTRFLGEFQLEWLDDDIIDLLERAGFDAMGTGLQSVNSATLRQAGRAWDEDRFLHNAEYVLRHTNIRLYVDVMYGLPGDTIADVQAGVDYIGALRSGDRRAVPVLYTTAYHPGTRTQQRALEGVVHEVEAPYRFLANGRKTYLGDHRRFRLMQLGSLVLRYVFPLTLDKVTSLLEATLGKPLSAVYEALGEFLATHPPTAPLTSHCDPEDFRGDLFVRAYLAALDPVFLEVFVRGADVAPGSWRSRLREFRDAEWPREPRRGEVVV